MLDSTADRVADAAVFGALLWWFSGPGQSRGLTLACLLCLVLGGLTSYVKARAEGLGLTANVGVAERAERLIIALVGTGLDGLGVPYVQAGALWLLVGLSTVTVGQRVAVVYRQSVAAGPITIGGPVEPGAPPATAAAGRAAGLAEPAAGSGTAAPGPASAAAPPAGPARPA
jgi:CDP-diacylglycerol--glycerol-3-phosphate 3-phosphatidyltransferase